VIEQPVAVTEVEETRKASQTCQDERRRRRITNGKSSYFDMDEAFCARLRMAITAGLESPPIGVITTPGTKRPKYVSELAARYHRPFNER
jgi:hypothetical protein